MIKENDAQSAVCSGNLSDAVVGHSLAVGFWTGISRATGFAKIVAVGAVLGPTYLGNIYQAVNSVPNIVYYSVLAGSLLPSLLVPPLVRHLDVQDRAAAERLAGSFLGIALVAFGIATIVFLAMGPVLVDLLSLGVRDAGAAAAQRSAGWLLLLLFLPQVVLYGVAGTAGAVMNAHQRFALAAAAPALENIGIVATLALSAGMFGTGTPVQEVQQAQLLVLGFGTTASVTLHAGLQVWGVRRLGFSLIPNGNWGDPQIRDLIRRALPAFGHAGLAALQSFICLVVANVVPGGVVAFEFALALYALPTALAANPIALALLPQLARLHHREAVQHFRDELVRGLRLAFFLTIPAAFAYAALSVPLARAVSFGEMAGPRGVNLVAVSLAAVALGVLGETAFALCTQASYARENARAPMGSMAIRTAVSLAGMVAALSLDGVAVLIAVGLSISIGNAAGAVSLSHHIGRGLPRSGEPLLPPLIRHVAAATLMLGPASLMGYLFPTILSSRLNDVLAMAAATIIGVTTYLVFQKTLGGAELGALAHAALPFRPREPSLRSIGG